MCVRLSIGLLAGELDAQLVYRKRLRRPLHEYQRNVRRTFAPPGWRMNKT